MTMFTWRLAVAAVPLLLACDGCSRPSSPSPASQTQPGGPEMPPTSDGDSSAPKRAGHLDIHVGREGGVNVDIERRQTPPPTDAPK